MILLLLACGRAGGGSGPGDTAPDVPGYHVRWHTDPDPPIAGEEAEFWQTIELDGEPVEDLQQSHERMVHNVFVSADLSSFLHLHHEDYNEVSADDLRTATYHFPVTFEVSGPHLAVFDYAHENAWLQSTDSLEVGGDLPQAEAPAEDLSTTKEVDGLVVSCTWEITPIAGYEAAWTVTITTAEGEDVVDLTQWLGADGHAVMVSDDLGFVTHTHAWFPGMEDVAPGHDMPHLYDGPTLPFHYTFSQAGLHKMWVQFARSAAPDAPFTVPFMFEVSP